MNIVPATIQMERQPNERYGFTLRHMVANPTDPDAVADMNHNTETLYVFDVNKNSHAQFAGLFPGDKIIMVNDLLVSNSPFNTIQEEIRNNTNLTFKVVPKFVDTLQINYDNLAANNQLIRD